MKKTALHNKHIELGAKMVPFAGFHMPIQYSGVNQEHNNVRNNVGVFDVSHMGEFLITGEHALELIQKISSNDASKLFPGRAQYSYLPNAKGGIIDDMLVYMMDYHRYMLVVNGSNIEKDWNWIVSQNNIGAELENISDNLSLIAVQGPKAAKVLQNLTSVNLLDIKFYHFEIGSFAGIENILISATGYTGSGGFELYVPNKNVEKLWDSIFNLQTEDEIHPTGLAARDTLRLEMGYCLYGNDIDEQTSPIAASLGWVTKFNKEFIGKEIIESHKSNGTENQLIAFELLERGIPRKDYQIVDSNEKLIGIVTSGTMGPTVKKGIGLGYVKTNHSKDGNLIYLKIRSKLISAKIVQLPFFKVL